ncbi:MAG: hypothetical protein BHV88_01695 [Clostridiales bacterium 41_12_two_minus]|jgi:hypothetical protein|nr:MAG: hypothetical protein BHV88_01695 [Clostridiales bacterium 41_12_two_minus]
MKAEEYPSHTVNSKIDRKQVKTGIICQRQPWKGSAGIPADITIEEVVLFYGKNAPQGDHTNQNF